MASISEQLYDALGIMILGMSLVFIFLSILIVAMTLVARKFGPTPPSESLLTESQPQSSQSAVSPLMAAVITAAIHQHRKKA
ncbi:MULTISPECIES: OadG family transporter subunit [unclassified Shewanella]|uniref:OadG family transporter subunit n=1 Tax=unclassified Shewanella TaxID=196818 RepID=UPI001BBA16B5|nr:MULTISPECIES: OadG family transporter subunit [unclassified Shewanella]GIU09449.1 putative oxaloacetate decarboxylase gamma chain [Shewanella sp. MBTL60-112-B1]GIU33950.1 putative oxaloacetate decarboxylase gamma chain [Shewanella sp. MBTL60-112-B2]